MNNNKKLNLNQEVTLEGKTYKIIGIDTYYLKNIFAGDKEWKSYTLIDNKNNKTWVSYGAIPDYFIQWSLVSKDEFKEESATPPNLELSGIANVTFEGNPGYSTPTAELVWFNLFNRKYDFVVYERFLKLEGENIEPEEPYYDAGKILRNFIA